MDNSDNQFEMKTLLIAVIERDGAILMRKKPEGSLPYKETWYLFGCEPEARRDDATRLAEYAQNELGVMIDSIVPIGEASEVKEDHDGIIKRFLYKSFRSRYQSGIPRVPAGAERVEWVPEHKLREYDIVPPSVELFKKLGIY